MLANRRMRELLSAIVLLTTITLSEPLIIATTTTSDGGLELNTELINQSYCIGDADLDGVRLSVRLRYRNVGNTPVILHKSSTTVYEIVVRKSPDGEIETKAQLSVYSDGPWKVSESDLKKSFVILQPHDSYVTETVARVFVTRDEAANFQGAVSTGEHYLQLTIGTWGGTPETESMLRQKWQSYGALWTDSVTSNPMRFIIDRNRRVLDCK